MRKIAITCLVMWASPALAGETASFGAPALGQVGLIVLAIAVGLLGGRSIRKHRDK